LKNGILKRPLGIYCAGKWKKMKTLREEVPEEKRKTELKNWKNHNDCIK